MHTGVQSGWAHQPASRRAHDLAYTGSFARLPAAAAPYIHANSHSRITVTVSKYLLLP